MNSNLAIVAGVGAFSEQVLGLAEKKFPGHRKYVISGRPLDLLPGSASLGTFWRDRDARNGRSVLINPFRFGQIAAQLKRDRVTRFFLVGDIPKLRFAQVIASEFFFDGSVAPILDKEAFRYFSGAPEALSKSGKYFHSLKALVNDCGAEVKYACQLFNELNLGIEDNTSTPIPAGIRLQIPQMVDELLKRRAHPNVRGLRPSQAAVISGSSVVEIEKTGTDNLLEDFGQKHPRSMAPYLLKVPTAEFDPVFDEPTIGPATVENCAKHGVKGIVVCAETTRVVNKAATLRRAAQLELFIYSVPFSQLCDTYLLHRSEWARDFAKVVAPHS